MRLRYWASSPENDAAPSTSTLFGREVENRATSSLVQALASFRPGTGGRDLEPVPMRKVARHGVRAVGQHQRVRGGEDRVGRRGRTCRR